jgi:putative peptide zinc metalloprotease protein
MYKEIEILRTDYENKYLIRLNDKTMRVGFMVKDIIEFLKEGRSRDEMQDYFKNQYELFVGKDVIDDVIENKINPFVIKQEDESFSKILTLFNPSVIPIPEMILKVFNKHFFYFMGFILFLTNAYFFVGSIRHHTESIIKTVIGYSVLLLILLVHELGHSLAAKRYDTDVKEIGLGWYIFFPVFYVDLNEVWRLSASKRIIINLAGIYLQLFCGVILLLLSVFVPELKEMLVMVFFMNFSIVILNVNPFLKFDGYWVLSDLLEGKDLSSVSNRIMKKWFHFEKSREEFVMIVYTVLRMFFMLFVISTFLRILYASIYKICTTGKIESSGVFIAVLVTLFIYRIFKKKKIKKDERLTRKF